ncbi:MAG: sigma-54 dependent transcriptional regulator [marine benthic group bacterium]|jgi:DNA-binding NtrC family response regulator|nr:sigma-54 dependent transcriptional regulator [Gemmatimonadota bacterium]MCL7963755.1 sigma-54 dependent transcriptional regulator [Candidatus Carthagonibacter metallireducens]MCL7958097.1 sigma-54 dependent transcriptional regulator [Gemmatimonadota bacterium]MCL7963818.1 sigma-54 dependent transcriptional regulator [Gemmatimonadota bacterium]MCL7966549.1 sigma-54 dependent transcriptional regulator [Gemmatimonadota bacterium]
MIRAALVVLFLAIPDFLGDCLTATDPHVPPSSRVNCTRSRNDRCHRERPPGRPEHMADERCRCCGLLGQSPAITDVLDVCDQISDTEFTVLITGETGTGKDLVARCIHMHSSRSKGRLTPVACAALPESLLESEMFGHRRGSFTGAVADQRGLVERANGGTLFLDEVDALTPAMQAKLLRVVEEHRIQRVGGNHDVPVDFRLIAATNSDLEIMVEEGRFRSDLFYRLNVIHLQIPPLRERADDIPFLASHFRDQFAREAAFPVVPFSEESLDWLVSQEWPGNVRELKHAVERAIVLSRGADEISPSHFGYGSEPISNGLDGSLLRHVLAGWDLKRLEEEYIRAVIRHTDGHRGEAAEILGIDRRTLYRKLEDLEA